MMRMIAFILSLSRGVLAAQEHRRQVAAHNAQIAEREARRQLLLDQRALLETRMAAENNHLVLQDLEIETKVARLKMTMMDLEDAMRRRGIRNFTPLDYPASSDGPALPGPGPNPESPDTRACP